MFVWNDFRSLALVAAAPLCKNDSDLAKLLAANSPAKEQTDDIGRPIPESVGIHQMTDPENFKRALRIRRDLAQNDRNSRYVSYADSLLRFLEAIVAGTAFFTVLIATKNATYQFLFAPKLKKMLAEKVIV